MTNPVLVVAAYLSIESSVVVGPWRLVNATTFEGPWASDGFAKRSEQLLSRLGGPDGTALGAPTLIVRVSGGADGVPPSGEELNGLQLAMDFAAVCGNPEWGSEEAEGFAFRVVTTDNTEIHCWPIDVESGFFAFDTGLLNRSLNQFLQPRLLSPCGLPSMAFWPPAFSFEGLMLDREFGPRKHIPKLSDIRQLGTHVVGTPFYASPSRP